MFRWSMPYLSCVSRVGLGSGVAGSRVWAARVLLTIHTMGSRPCSATNAARHCWSLSHFSYESDPGVGYVGWSACGRV